MPRPKDAKVWNEDLVRALKAREDVARRQGKNSLNWKKGWQEIEAVRGDIYCFANGRIANYPTNKLGKTVDNLLRSIIDGTTNILPDGYVAPGFAESSGNPFMNDPYCNRIKKRGGAFAILMAFHVSGAQIMTKDQICSIAQPFCDEEMDSNYFAGRNRGAWAANKTLIDHDLIAVNRTAQYNERAGGIRSNGCWKYMITNNGKLFIEALLQKNPDLKNQIELVRGNVANLVHRDDPVPVPMAPLPAAAFPSPSREKKSSSNIAKDAKDLREWVQSASIGEQKQFKVGKERRRCLHDLCDKINLELRGKRLQHESMGDARLRTLYVTVMPRYNEASLPVKRSPPRPLSSVHVLNEGSPAKRPAIPAKVAAANAALERQAIHKSLAAAAVTPEVVNLCDSDDDDDIGICKPPPVNRELLLSDDKDSMLSLVRRKSPPMAKLPPKIKPSSIVDLFADSDSDDDIPDSVLFKSMPQPKKPPESKPIVKKHSSVGQEMIICIDDRERNRNHTPRMLRLELTRLVTSGLLAAAWPNPLPKVEERRLESGDFCYIVPKVYGITDLPVLVERKRIGDLVQRSYKKDHWYQLQRMQNEVEERGGGTCFLLLEGSVKTVHQFTPFGSQEVESFSPYCHAIDDEDSLYRFFGRAVLNDRLGSTQFIHAKDEQESLRMVGAIGLLLATSTVLPTSQARVDSKSERECVRNRLTRGGIPFKIAERISDEVSSPRKMNRIYAAIDDEGCRDQLFATFLSDLVGEVMYSGSPFGWSRAVHRVWLSSLEDPSKGGDLFNEYSHIVEDHALLLSTLHSGLSPEIALEEVLSSPEQRVDDSNNRTVEVTAPHEYHIFFPEGLKGSLTFYRLCAVQSAAKIPSVGMQTICGPYKSPSLFVFLLDGSDFIDRIQTIQTKGAADTLPVVARNAARSLMDDLGTVASGDSKILLLRALNNAFDQAARKNRFRSETRVLVDLVMVELMISHRIVILHAHRLKGDQEKVVQQLALACLHYHVLDRVVD